MLPKNINYANITIDEFITQLTLLIDHNDIRDLYFNVINRYNQKGDLCKHSFLGTSDTSNNDFFIELFEKIKLQDTKSVYQCIINSAPTRFNIVDKYYDLIAWYNEQVEFDQCVNMKPPRSKPTKK